MTVSHSRPSSRSDAISTYHLKQAIDDDDEKAVKDLITAGADLETAIGPDGQSALLWSMDANKEKARHVIAERLYQELKEKRDAQAKVRAPTTWTIFQHDGPNHLGLCCNAAP